MGLFGGLLSGLAGAGLGFLTGGPAGAVAGGLSGLTSGIGASHSSKAINNASNAQIAAEQQAIAEQQREYDTSRADFAPFMQFGTGSLGQLGDLLGLNGNAASSSAIANLKSSPLFTSLFNTGQEAVLQNASATGGVRGGNVQSALYENGQSTLAQVIRSQIANLFGAAGVGQGATGSVASAGQNSANQISALDGNIGAAQAGRYLGQAGVQNNLLNQLSAIFNPKNAATNLASIGIHI